MTSYEQAEQEAKDRERSEERHRELVGTLKDLADAIRGPRNEYHLPELRFDTAVAEEAMKLYQPPGATMTENQGVGMGEGEKVAQEGSQGLREWIEGMMAVSRHEILGAENGAAKGRVDYYLGRVGAFGDVLNRLAEVQDLLETETCTPPEPAPTADETAYRNSAQLLRLAAMKFSNPRGRFEDLRPEIDEILRRKYPATEEMLSCTPPVPPATAPAAEETSSGGGRCGSTTVCPVCGRGVSVD